MSENFIITLECSKQALGQLIATGLEQHATITKVEAAKSSRPKPEPEPTPAPKPHVTHRLHLTAPPQVMPKPTKIKRTRKLIAWVVYQAAIDAFHPQKDFTTHDLARELRRSGHEASLSAVSAHLTRLRAISAIRSDHGDRVTGYINTVNKVMTRTEMERRIKQWSAS